MGIGQCWHIYEELYTISSCKFNSYFTALLMAMILLLIRIYVYVNCQRFL